MDVLVEEIEQKRKSLAEITKKVRSVRPISLHTPAPRQFWTHCLGSVYSRARKALEVRSHSWTAFQLAWTGCSETLSRCGASGSMRER